MEAVSLSIISRSLAICSSGACGFHGVEDMVEKGLGWVGVGLQRRRRWVALDTKMIWLGFGAHSAGSKFQPTGQFLFLV
jgi:hypothetical protein